MSLRPNPPPDAAAIITMSWAELARVRGNPDPDRWISAADLWVKPDENLGWCARKAHAPEHASGDRRLVTAGTGPFGGGVIYARA